MLEHQPILGLFSMNTKKYLLISSAIAIFLGGAFWFLASRIFDSETMVIESPLKIAPVNVESSEETNSTDDLSLDTIINKNEHADTKQKQAVSAQDFPDNSKDIQPVELSDQEEKTTDTASFIKQKLVSWGFQKSSSRKIDTIIIHSSYNALGDEPYDVDGLLDIYKQYGVSAHYLIDREGTVLRLVEDKNIAYHAGVSSVPDGRTNVNFFSIGIELMNTKEDKCTSSQYKSLNKLLDLLENNYSIKYTLGHDDIAPNRKDDPWNFDWDKVK